MKRIYKYILTITIMLTIIILGTYAWLSYKSNKTAMVLIIGDINNIEITLSPYQINTKILPSVSYEDEEFTTIRAVNNGAKRQKFTLVYNINKIDSELAISDFKYTILKSTDNGRNYTEYLEGDFAGLTDNSVLNIATEEVPNNTTYLYKVYV